MIPVVFWRDPAGKLIVDYSDVGPPQDLGYLGIKPDAGLWSSENFWFPHYPFTLHSLRAAQAVFSHR